MIHLQEIIFILFLIVQVLLPLKRYVGAFFLSKNLMGDYGSFFSWSQEWIMKVGRIKLHVRRFDGVRLFTIKTSSDQPVHVFGEVIFNREQIFYFLSSPRAVVQLADLIKNHLEGQGIERFIITANYELNINQRGLKVYIDPYADLIKAKEGAIYEQGR